MVNRKKLIGGVVVPFFMFAAFPMASAQELGSNSVIVAGSQENLEFPELEGESRSISVSPLLAEKHARVASQPTELDPSAAKSILAKTKAKAVLDFGPQTQPSLRLMPFDVHTKTQVQDWARVSEALSPEAVNKLVILRGSGEPKITTELSVEDIRDQWAKLFEKHSTVRVLGLSNVVYVEPVANDAKKKREDVLQRYVDTIRAPKAGLPSRQWRMAIDRVFTDISEDNVNNDAIAGLAAVWKTDLRKLFDNDSLDSANTKRITEFSDNLETVLKDGVRSHECLVTVSTSPGPGADIRYFKSLIGEQSAKQFGTSTVGRKMERALWTFVSRRKGESGEWVETGRVEKVECPDETTFNFVINESE